MMTDREIEERILVKIQWDPQIDERDISVAVSREIVTITGSVRSQGEKRLVEECIKSVRGVYGVVNQLRVIRAESNEVSDSEIAREVLRKIKENPRFTGEEIKVFVEEGEVRLHGEIHENSEMDDLAQQIKEIPGIKGVVSCFSKP